MNKTKYFLIILFLQISAICYSQYQVILQPPPPYKFKVDDLWKITLINDSGDSARVRLYGTVFSIDKNKVIADATTSVFTLQKGTKIVNAREISPVDVDKKRDSELENILNATGTFPSGSYRICIYLQDASNNFSVLDDDCNSIGEVINTTRMDLLSPENEEEILYQFPSFSWLPPTPVPPRKVVTYQFQIVEVLNRQTPEYSFLSNPILFYSQNTSRTLFQYPAAATPLINNRRYAWKVITLINNVKLTESPVWEFTYNGDNKDNIKINKDIRKNLIDSIPKGSIGDFDESEASGYPQFSRKQNIEDDLPLPKSINTKVAYEFNDKPALNSEVQKNFGSINVDIEGAPFNVNLYFDTKEMELKQNLNSLGLYLNPEKLKDKIGLGGKKTFGASRRKTESENPLSKFFSFFDTFGLGDTYPYYTPSTVNGAKMTGADIAINPGLFYLGISGLNNLDAVPGSTFSRKMFAGRIGIGSKDKSRFHLILMKAWDNPNSLNINTLTSTISPMENYVSGIDAAWKLYKDQITISIAANGSTLKRDLNAPELTQEQLDKIAVPKFLKNIIDPNMSTQYGFMFEVSSGFVSKDFGTNFEASLKYIDPGYTSLAAPNVRSDIQSLNFKISNPFFKKRVQASVLFQIEENNLLNLNTSTSKSKKFGFNLKVNFPGYPYLIADYRPNSVSNKAIADSLSADSILFQNKSNVLSIISGMSLNSKSFSNSVSLVLTNFSSSSNLDSNDYSILNLILSNSLTFFKFPLTFTGSAGFTKNKVFQTSNNSFLFDLSAAYTFLEKWNNSLGISYYTEEKTNTRSSVYFNSSYPIGKFLSFNVDLIKDYYSEKIFQYGNKDNFTIRAGITSLIK